MLCLLMGLGLCGCSDDEQPLPAYVQTLADLEVGNPASRQTLVLEDGERCGLLNMLSGVRPDTMLRVCVAYTACTPANPFSRRCQSLCPRWTRFAPTPSRLFRCGRRSTVGSTFA